MFEAGKTYKTRDGRDFRVYATDGVPPYSIHGAVKHSSGWLFGKRYADGTVYGRYNTDPADLVPDPPPIDITKPCRTRDGRSVANLRKSGDYIVGDIVNRATGATIVDALWRPNGRNWAEKETVCDLIQCAARPWTRADVPWPRPEFRGIASDTGNWMIPSWTSERGVNFSACGFVSWANLQANWQYSVDGGKTWMVCEVVE